MSPDTFALEVPILMPLIEPEGDEPLPAAWQEGVELFAQAETRCDEEAYGDAAELFLGAGRALVAADDGPFGEAAPGARQACYANAWQCFIAAGEQTRGAQALEQDAAADPALADEIAAILADR